MKTLNNLADFLEKKADNIDKVFVKINDIVAKKVYNDIIQNAPMGKGVYRASIKIYPTTIENSRITTFIGSDLLVGPTIWGNYMGCGNAPGGTYYNLAYLLEHGTTEHAIPNAFNRGFYYGYTDEDGVFHKGTLDKDWHPGSIAQPHYRIALEKNKKFYKDNIKISWR